MCFELPKQVKKLLDSEHQFTLIIEEHIKNQKLKIDLEMQSIRDTVD
jgi:hypothetical protein